MGVVSRLLPDGNADAGFRFCEAFNRSDPFARMTTNGCDSGFYASVTCPESLDARSCRLIFSALRVWQESVSWCYHRTVFHGEDPLFSAGWARGDRAPVDSLAALGCKPTECSVAEDAPVPPTPVACAEASSLAVIGRETPVETRSPD